MEKEKESSKIPLNKANKANIINENNFNNIKENNQYLKREIFPIEDNKYDHKEIKQRNIILNKEENKFNDISNEIDTNIKVLNECNKENEEINERLNESIKDCNKTNESLSEMYKKWKESLNEINEKLDNIDKRLNENFNKRLNEVEKNFTERLNEIDKNFTERLNKIDKNLTETLNKIRNSTNDSQENNNNNKTLDENDLTIELIQNLNEEKCLICLENYCIKEKISYLPCLHFFHSSCIKKWITIKNSCPLCNNYINFED